MTDHEKFLRRICEIINQGWILNQGNLSRDNYEEKIKMSIINSMGFETEEYLQWVSDNGDHKRYEFNLNQNSIVIDCGGFDGKWSEEIFNRYNCHIHIFEPVREYFLKIVELFKDNVMVKVYNYGLGETDKKELIHINGDQSSIFGNGDEEEIKILDFKKWLVKEGIDNVDLMKLNCEGSEYPLLMDMVNPDNNTHLKIDNFLIQFHRFPVHYQSMFECIHNEFKKSHDIVFQYNYIWEHLQRKNPSNKVKG